MTNATILLGATWASSHRYTRAAGDIGTWAAACEHAYEMLRDSHTPAEQEHLEITQLEPQHVETRYGRTVMIWSAWAHLPGRDTPLRYDVLDDLPRDESAPSVRVGATRPTPAPPSRPTFSAVNGTH